MIGKGGLKIFLTVANVLFFIIGGIALGIGIWMTVDKIFISDIIGTSLFSAAAYMMILGGVILLVISFLGVYGAATENKTIILIYIISTSVTFLLLILAGILAAAFKGELDSSMVSAMRSSLVNHYGYDVQYNAENRRITDSWDLTQKMLRCCSVEDDGYPLYRDSQWFKTYHDHKIEKDSIQYIPQSCCKYIERIRQYEDVKKCQSNQYGPPSDLDPNRAVNDAMYYKGCYQAAKDFVAENAGILVALGFCFGLLLVAGIIFAVLLYRSLGKFIPVRTHEETVHMG